MTDFNFHERRLARSLVVLRQEAGLNQLEAARAVNMKNQKLSRIEKGQAPSYHELCALLDVYGLVFDQWQPYKDRLEEAKSPGWWRAYGLAKQNFVSLEDEASLECEYQLGYVPGLFQIEPYIRAILGASRVTKSARRTDLDVEIRLRRQRRLFGPNPLRLHAIVEASALTSRMPDADVAIAQLRHIVEMSVRPNITFQVLPGNIGPHDGQNGTFIVLRFPDPADPDVLYIEHSGGSMHVEAASQVKASRLSFEHLATLALEPDESRNWVEKVISGL
ncbi:helix-turn-helix domain-containing protein [Solihabitans fulvus]|nr:helix-turn-helix transcriptional regulator [Solihabitans fulvus]